MDTNQTDELSTPVLLHSSYDADFSPVIPLIPCEMLPSNELPPKSLKYEKKSAAIIEPDEILWASEYSEDIYRTYRVDELKRRKIKIHSAQSCYRPIIIHKMTSSSRRLELNRLTLHLAVYYMDCVLDRYTMRTSKLVLVATTCLALAAKIEETNAHVPQFSQMNNMLKTSYELSEYQDAEIRLVRVMHFDLIRPTVATFADYFSLSMITLGDYHTYIRNWHTGKLCMHDKNSLQPCLLPLFADYKEMQNYLKEIMYEMVDSTLTMAELVNSRPSMIAAATIAVVRRLNYVFPMWTPYLRQFTEYNEDDLAEIIECLMVQQCAANNTHKTSVCSPPDTGSNSDSGYFAGNVTGEESTFDESTSDNDGNDGGKNNKLNQQPDETKPATIVDDDVHNKTCSSVVDNDVHGNTCSSVVDDDVHNNATSSVVDNDVHNNTYSSVVDNDVHDNTCSSVVDNDVHNNTYSSVVDNDVLDNTCSSVVDNDVHNNTYASVVDNDVHDNTCSSVVDDDVHNNASSSVVDNDVLTNTFSSVVDNDVHNNASSSIVDNDVLDNTCLSVVNNDVHNNACSSVVDNDVLDYTYSSVVDNDVLDNTCSSVVDNDVHNNAFSSVVDNDVLDNTCSSVVDNDVHNNACSSEQ